MKLAFPKPEKRDKDSPWRECRFKGKRCERVFRKWRGSSTLCIPCWFDRKKQRATEAIDRRKRVSKYTKPKPRFWNARARRKHLEQAEMRCEVCMRPEAEQKKLFDCGLTRDHFLPVRFITGNRLGDPHLDLNILVICSECHGIKAGAEVKLFDGDFLGFVTELLKRNWPKEEFGMVLKHYRCFPTSLKYLLEPKQ